MGSRDAPARRTAQQRTSDWRRQITLHRETLRHAFLDGGRGFAVLALHTAFVDRLLADAWIATEMPEGAALVAVGGYGRRAMFPWSDVDVLILIGAEPDRATAERLETFVGQLWDMGLEVGHSIRTVDECMAQARQDITIQTNLLESRCIAGDATLYARFAAAFAAALDPRQFCEAKLLEQQQRHGRYNDAAYSLEPNLKENPGGLRDLQVILWIARASGLGDSWQDLVTHDIVTPQEATRLERHERLLQGLRVRLHYLAGRREDRLLFDLQAQLAAEMGFHETPARRASEQLMQRVYRTLKSVLQLSSIVLANLRLRIFPPPPDPGTPLDAHFTLRHELIEIDDAAVFDREPGRILDAFHLWQRHPEAKGLSAATQRALWHARRHVNASFRRSATHRDTFMRIVRHPAGVTHTLRRMNRFGVLGLYLPAFGRIVGRMQHDLFHVYTVDEHILMVVRNLRRFANPEMGHEYPLCSRLMSEFARPEVLLLAGLFHDIAKGRGGDHSILGRADALRFCRMHAIGPADTDLVAWLVEHHLVMSATAQKEDLSDERVIARFAELVGTDRRLVALYLLTVADIRGTSPKVWNAWKGKLLEDLFRATRRLLGGETSTVEGSINDRKEKVRTTLRGYAIADGREDALWSKLGDGYFLRHDAPDIAWHTRQLWWQPEPATPVVRARLSPVGEGLQVLIYAPDQPLLFAHICVFFERLALDILDARVHTTRHGYALDTFEVMDPSHARSHYRDLIAFVEHELAAKLVPGTRLDPPTRGRITRQVRAFPLTPEVTLRPDERGQFHYLSLIAADRPGLLSRVARTFADYGIDVRSAKINTLGARAEDTFVVSGAGLRDPRQVIKLEAELLRDLHP
jgi:[protein-PII] uridylyltransferase